MVKQGGDRPLGGGRHHYLQIGLAAQQFGGGDPQQAALATATVGAQHQRTATMAVQHLVDGGQGKGLIVAQGTIGPQRLPGLAIVPGLQRERRIPFQQPHQPGDKAVPRLRGLFGSGHQPHPIRVRVAGPLRPRRSQQQQQTASTQGTCQRPEGVWVKAAEGVEHQGVALLPEPLQRLGCRQGVMTGRPLPEPEDCLAEQGIGTGNAVGLLPLQPDQPPLTGTGQALAQVSHL